MKCPHCGSEKVRIVGDKLVCWKCGEVVGPAVAKKEATCTHS